MTATNKFSKLHPVVRALHLLVAAGLLGVIVACFQTFVNREPAYVYADMSLLFEDAEKGLAPNGEEFTTISATGEDLVEKAIQNTGLSVTTEEVSKNLFVQGIFPEDIIDEVTSYDSLLNADSVREQTVSQYYTTSYRFVLYNGFDSKIKSSDLAKLLEEIISLYRENYLAEYRAHFDKTNNAALFVDESFDYAQQLNVVKTKLTLLERYIEECYNQDPNYVLPNGSTFRDLLLKAQMIEAQDLASLESLVEINALSLNAQRLQYQYEEKLDSLTNRLTEKQEALASVTAVMTAYDRDDLTYIAIGDTVTEIKSSSSATYDKLATKKNALSLEIADIKKEITEYTQKKADVQNQPGGASAIAQVEEGMVTLAATIDALADEFESDLTAYTQEAVSEDDLVITPVSYYSDGVVSFTFIASVIKCAGPLCVLMLLAILGKSLADELKKQKTNQTIHAE